MQPNAISSNNPLLAVQRQQLMAARRPAPAHAAAAPAPAAALASALRAMPTLSAPVAFTAPSAPPTPVAAPPSAPAELFAGSGQPLEQLLKDWGRSDSTFDLDADGKVGMRDLMLLLARMGKPAPGEEPTRNALNRDAGNVAGDAAGRSPIERLVADWGKTGSEFDLDGNGTVGMPDLLMLLNRLREGAAGVPGEPGADIDPTTDDQARSPLQALLADWGKTGSKWDLDGNGTVGIQDLLSLLKQMQEAATSGAAPAPLDGPSVDGTDGKTPLQRLQAEWGKTDSTYDLDRDGTVGMGDMLRMLSDMRAAAPRQEVAAGAAPPAETLAAAPRALRSRATAAHVAAALMPRLEQHRDPALVRAELDRSQLSDPQKELLRARVAALTSTGRVFSALG